MKENIKLGLLGFIAIASVVNLVMLSGIRSKQGEMNEAQSAVVANNVAATTQQPNGAMNPADAIRSQLPEGTTMTENTVVPPPSDMKKTTVSWSKMVHDFGKIKQNSENKFAFEFKNTGTEPMLITNAVGSCGCTVPDYPKEPIAPGKSATINVVYKPGLQENQQEKIVTVTANTDPYQTQLKIRAFVEKEK